LAQNKIKLW